VCAELSGLTCMPYCDAIARCVWALLSLQDCGASFMVGLQKSTTLTSSAPRCNSATQSAGQLQAWQHGVSVSACLSLWPERQHRLQELQKQLLLLQVGSSISTYAGAPLSLLPTVVIADVLCKCVGPPIFVHTGGC